MSFPTRTVTNSTAGAFLLAGLLTGATAVGAVEALTPSRRLCDPDKIAQTNVWVDCLQKAIDRSEADLSALERKIVAAMRAADILDEPKRSQNLKLFETTQAKWLVLREDDCRSFATHHAGLGFGAVQFRLVCLLDATVERVQALKQRYSDDLQ